MEQLLENHRPDTCEDLFRRLYDDLFEDPEDNMAPLGQLKEEPFLNSFDYNLNSPLIKDRREAFEHLLDSGESDPRFPSPHWKELAAHWRLCFNAIEAQTGIPISLTPSHGHHGEMAKLFLGPYLEHREFEGFIKRVNNIVKKVQPCVTAFFKGLGIRDEDCRVHTRIRGEAMRYGSIHHDLYLITLLLNCRTETEKDNLIRNVYKSQGTVSVEGKNMTKIFRISTPSLGAVYVGGEFVFLENSRTLLDRNFMLMIKDTAKARFNSILSLEDRLDDKFSQGILPSLLKLYKMGDNLLVRAGVQAYDSISLLEPLCVERWKTTAQLARPLLRLKNTFWDHLNRKINGLPLHQRITCKLMRDLIDDLDNPQDIGVIYGSFRHWGHPYIDYLEGLERLHEQVTMHKTIDTAYANLLASDLAKKVLNSHFKDKGEWACDLSQMQKDHPMYNSVRDKTANTAAINVRMEGHWHELPITRVYELPDLIDPTILYADKSHSIPLREIKEHLQSGKRSPIPSRRVMETMCKRPSTIWGEFIRRVDAQGIDAEELVIGLKAKERELKIRGRFFALMSWELREYFVVSEYLIKENFLNLFPGITMTDSLTQLLQKMLKNSQGQGLFDYAEVKVANHFDYSKWNNHQREEATRPVFEVMDKCLGLTNFIARTHSFFQDSLIYYNDRADLMTVENGRVVNSGPDRVCWQGQEGGLEGLRQKGWSILNLLMLERECSHRNTHVDILAQGDNQVVCLSYEVEPHMDNTKLEQNLRRIVLNNEYIVDRIRDGAENIGLIINQDETVQSSEFIVYGKHPIWRGNLMGLDTKRFSRVGCVTNDQLPTIGNVLSSVTTNLLTVAHYSDSFRDSILQYPFFGVYAILYLFYYDPAISQPIFCAVKNKDRVMTQNFWTALLFLDPSLGGVCGTSLTRFLIRMFPDPVTESLVFWKIVFHNTEDEGLKNLAKNAGHPKIASYTLEKFKKLIENPTSLNIVGGVNPTLVLKERIRGSMRDNRESFGNEIVRMAILYREQQDEPFVNFCRAITPCFPRFFSEFWAASFLGLVTSITSLFENSRTIRKLFSKRMGSDMLRIIRTSELASISALLKLASLNSSKIMWSCSSSHADLLRSRSWRTEVRGATIPHPAELLSAPQLSSPFCTSCTSSQGSQGHVSVVIPHGLRDYRNGRGPYKPYLGSATSGNTQLANAWEKQTNLPFIRRAAEMRRAIGWFIPRNSVLSRSILANLQSLTGEDWTQGADTASQTGCPEHRWSSTRQSSGGFLAVSPSRASYMIVTTDDLGVGSLNVDFMFQSLLVYSTTLMGEIGHDSAGAVAYHLHFGCGKCIREIRPLELSVSFQYRFPDRSDLIRKLIPERITLSGKVTAILDIPLGLEAWGILSPHWKSRSFGLSIGFLYGVGVLQKGMTDDDGSMFPMNIASKLIPCPFLEGLTEGLLRTSALQGVYQMREQDKRNPRHVLRGVFQSLLDSMRSRTSLLQFFNHPSFLSVLMSVSHKQPSSYPLSGFDTSRLLTEYLFSLTSEELTRSRTVDHWADKRSKWLFEETTKPVILGQILVSDLAVTLMTESRWGKECTTKSRYVKGVISMCKDGKKSDSPEQVTSPSLQNWKKIPSEIRHAIRESGIVWEEQPVVGPLIPIKYPLSGSSLTLCQVTYSPSGSKPEKIACPRHSFPLIASLRLVQLSSGSHYKLGVILHELGLQYHDFLCGGDGSGGLTALLLRQNHNARGIFNSLLPTERGQDFRGAKPSGPPAVGALGAHSSRCVNYTTAWEEPSDLSEEACWTQFLQHKKTQDLFLDLMVFDMECKDEETGDKIERLLLKHGLILLDRGGTIIFKTYVHRLNRDWSPLLSLGSSFSRVLCVQTSYTSSFSSEVYVVLRGMRSNPDPYALYPHKKELSSYLKESYAFANLQSELIRGQKLSPWDDLKKFPSAAQILPHQEIYHLMSVAGVPPTWTEGVRQHLISSRSVHQQTKLAELAVLLVQEHVFKLGNIRDPGISPPTNKDLLRGLSAIEAYRMRQAYAKSDLKSLRSSKFHIEDGYPIYFGCRKTISKGGKGHTLYLRHWSENSEHPTKDIPLQASLAYLSSWLRVLMKLLGKSPYSPTLKEIRETSKSVTPNLLSNDYFLRCGMYSKSESKTADGFPQ